MSNKIEKPYVLRAAEFVYSNIIDIKKQNSVFKAFSTLLIISLIVLISLKQGMTTDIFIINYFMYIKYSLNFKDSIND